MDHPSYGSLSHRPLAPEVREHVARCAKCRIEARLYLSSARRSESASVDLRHQRPGALPSPGERIDGFEICSLIGSGGFGEVLLAERFETGDFCAIKVARDGSPALRARMQREFMAGQTLSHPNVLPTHALIEICGRPSVVTPYIPGCSLDLWLVFADADLGQRLWLVDGLLAGLAHAHGAGVIHRDLKPQNILLDPRSGSLVPIIADFGLARLREGAGDLKTRSGSAMGTIAFCAPEQLRDASKVDPRADLFSVGVILYLMLTDRLPFEQTDIVARQEAVAARAYRPLVEAVPGIDPALAALVDALLSVEPSDRPERAEQVRLALSLPQLRVFPERSLEIARRESARIRGLRPAARGAARAAAPIVGRQHEIASVLAHLEAPARILTLHGPGGVGKTALCRAILASPRLTLADWPGSAWFVRAGGCGDESSIALAVASELGLRLPGSESAEALVGALAARGPTLIALDEIEGCIDGARAIAERIRIGAPEVSLLCTSRLPVGADAEQILPVEPLPLEDAVVLFLARAESARGRALSASEASSVRDLVSRLDGLPLALELAAGRTARLSPADLLARLDRMLQLLTSQERNDRHASLSRAIEASWETLDADAARMGALASVFAAPFDLAAAEAVLDAPVLLADDLLGSLVSRALLQVEETEGGPRFRMLESVRAFASLRLGDERDLALCRHRDHFLRVGQILAERVWEYTRDRDIRALAALLPELRAILARFDDPETIVRAAVLGASGTFWTAGGGHLFLERALEARSALPEGPLAWSYDVVAFTGSMNVDVSEQIERMPPLLRAFGTVSLAGQLCWMSRPGDMLALAERARASRLFEGYPALGARCAQFEAIATGYAKGVEHSEPMFRDVLARIDPSEQPSLALQTHSLLVDIVQQRGGDAGELARQGLRMSRRVADPLQRALADGFLGVHLCRSGALGEGIERLQQAEAGAWGAPRAQRKMRLGLAEFLPGDAGEQIGRALAEETGPYRQQVTVTIARALVAMHALLDGRREGADEALAQAEAEVVSPLLLARIRTARALLARTPLLQPLDERLPVGLRRVLSAAAQAAARGSPGSAELAQAVSVTEPHLSFYAQHTVALLSAILEHAP